jgi:hypothetical protein
VTIAVTSVATNACQQITEGYRLGSRAYGLERVDEVI